MSNLIYLAYGIGCGTVFSGIAVTSKLMTPSIPALIKVFLRFLIGSVCLIPFLSRAEFIKVTKWPFYFLG